MENAIEYDSYYKIEKNKEENRKQINDLELEEFVLSR